MPKYGSIVDLLIDLMINNGLDTDEMHDVVLSVLDEIEQMEVEDNG